MIEGESGATDFSLPGKGLELEEKRVILGKREEQGGEEKTKG